MIRTRESCIRAVDLTPDLNQRTFRLSPGYHRLSQCPPVRRYTSNNPSSSHPPVTSITANTDLEAVTVDIATDHAATLGTFIDRSFTPSWTTEVSGHR